MLMVFQALTRMASACLSVLTSEMKAALSSANSGPSKAGHWSVDGSCNILWSVESAKRNAKEDIK